MSSTPSSKSSSSSRRSIADLDPYTRNAMRFSMSAREYELLHQYVLSKSTILNAKTPEPARRRDEVEKEEDYNAATIRASMRLFLAGYAGLELWDLVLKRLARRSATPPQKRQPFLSSPNFRLSLSLSTLLLFHRLLHRFFLRLRSILLSSDARAFRLRNPQLTHLLTSRLAPALGASLSGFLLALAPAVQTRMTLTIYAFTKSLEFLYNALEERGHLGRVPSWVGSWMIMPPAMAQLLHAFVFDRECFPASFGNFIMKRSPAYLQQRPQGYPEDRAWPSTDAVVDALADVSRLKWPAFVSPVLFPAANRNPGKALPTPALRITAAITDRAHPALKRLSCAILHPGDPSCVRTHLTYYSRSFPTTAKYLTLIYTVLALPRYKAFLASPLPALNELAAKILRTSLFITAAIGSAWGSVCLFGNVLPGSVMPRARWYVSGALAGCWAAVDGKGGRGNYLYCARLSLDSLWKVGRKRGWWGRREGKGEVWIFVACLALMNAVYELQPSAVRGAMVRKTLGVLRGDGWVDRAKTVDEVEGEEEEVEETRVGEAIGEEVEGEEVKGEETKVENAKVEEAKVEEAKVEEAKVEEAKVEEAKVKEAKVDDAKAEEVIGEEEENEVLASDNDEAAVHAERDGLSTAAEAAPVIPSATTDTSASTNEPAGLRHVFPHMQSNLS